MGPIAAIYCFVLRRTSAPALQRLGSVLFATFALAASVVAFPATAQLPQRVFKVGLVWNSVPQSNLDDRVSPSLKLVEDGLRDLGWVRGRNVELLSKSIESHYERFPAIIDAFVRMPVDVLVVFSPEAAKFAQSRTETIPIVFAGSFTLGARGRPKGNLTGTTFVAGSPVDKRLELLKAIAPQASHVAMFAQVRPGQVKPTLPPETMEAAGKLGMKLFPVYFEAPEHLEQSFEQARRQGANALYMSLFPELTWAGLQTRLQRLAAKHKLPAVYEQIGMAKAGGLLDYGPDFDDAYRRAPYFIDRLLRGAKAADLPIEQPMKFYLNINRRTARELGLDIPGALLIQADNVFD